MLGQMKLHPRLSRAAIELVTRFETFQPQAQPAAAGGWTLGYGHTRSAREGAGVSRADAEALLLYDLSAAAEAVTAALFAPVTQRQFEALTAFAFNIGVDNFRRSSALACVNAGAELDAADEIERWRRAELGAGAQVVDALVRRRAAEKAHFLGLPEGFSKSPSAVLRPLAAAGGEALEPPPPPVEVAAPSATLHAANSVQARLRALVPEPEQPQAPDSMSLEAPPFDEPDGYLSGADPDPMFDFETPLAGQPVVAKDIIYPVSPEPEPIPLTSEGEAVLPLPPPPPPPPGGLADLASPKAHAIIEPEPVAMTMPSRPLAARARVTARALFALLTAFGACLFVAAAVLILIGKPGFGNLALGVAGALIMTPGVYGLLGPGPAEAAAVTR